MTTKFLIFSDLHAHNFHYAATRRAIPGLIGLYNSRLADTISVLDEILQSARDEAIEHVVFCGDLFHKRTSVSTDVRYAVVNRLCKFAKHRIHLHMILGNHDMGDRNGNVHNLVGIGDFSKYIHVYDDVSFVDLEDVTFVFIPYTDSYDKINERLIEAQKIAERSKQPAILFAHQGVQGARVGSDYVLVADSDISVSDIPYKSFAACFFGHFHEHQALFPNGWYVGSTHQHNWGDAYGSRGYLLVEVSDDGTVEFEQLRTMAPEFIVTRDGKTSTGDLTIMKANDFVRNITKDPVEKDWDVGHLETILEDDDYEPRQVSLDKLDPESFLEEWVDSRLPARHNRDEALKCGKEFLIGDDND